MYLFLIYCYFVFLLFSMADYHLLVYFVSWNNFLLLFYKWFDYYKSTLTWLACLGFLCLSNIPCDVWPTSLWVIWTWTFLWRSGFEQFFSFGILGCFSPLLFVS